MVAQFGTSTLTGAVSVLSVAFSVQLVDELIEDFLTLVWREAIWRDGSSRHTASTLLHEKVSRCF